VNGGRSWKRCFIRNSGGARATAYLAIKYHADHRNRDRIEQITAALAQMGLRTLCIARDVEAWGQVVLDARTLMRISFDAIDASELMVVDLTEKGVGVGIEAGYAFARGVPIVAIAETGADMSETLRGISTCVSFYGNAEELRQALAEACSVVQAPVD
jgi:2'-deoxynucleoside 5'-phosphate N-hydrolase